MRSFSRESELRDIVANYLASGSFLLQDEEVQFFEYSIDQYGYSTRRDEAIAVELKLSKWSRALEQALIYQLCADTVVVAVPRTTAARADVSQFEQHGVGLLAVLPDGRCEEVVVPRRSRIVREHYRDALIGRLREQI